MNLRILETTASQFAGMRPPDLLAAIRGSEGRTVLAEVACSAPPLVDGVSDPELAAAFGADMILLNFYDVLCPLIQGLPLTQAQTAGDVKKMIGRPVGVNLEPGSGPSVSPGRMATADNAARALRQGADFVLLTGNPRTGVTNESVEEAVRSLKGALGRDIIVMAGRMHSSGVSQQSGASLITPEGVALLARAGADVVLVPAPGTVPGMTVESVRALVAAIHGERALAMTSVGTSQEGADPATIRDIALYSKMTGTDIHHIGDAGFVGIAAPENITAYSVAIRGKRHTYRRMASSLLR